MVLSYRSYINLVNRALYFWTRQHHCSRWFTKGLQFDISTKTLHYSWRPILHRNVTIDYLSRESAVAVKVIQKDKFLLSQSFSCIVYMHTMYFDNQYFIHACRHVLSCTLLCNLCTLKTSTLMDFVNEFRKHNYVPSSCRHLIYNEKALQKTLEFTELVYIIIKSFMNSFTYSLNVIVFMCQVESVCGKMLYYVYSVQVPSSCDIVDSTDPFINW